MPTRKPSATPRTSTVYFAPVTGENADPHRAIETLFQRVVTEETISKGDYVALKLHFGEAGNVRYLRPTYIRRLAELVQRVGGEPFATDTVTLYRQQRSTLFLHLKTAAAHGFTAETLGCPVLIADGLRSTGVEVEVEDPLELDRCLVGQAIYDADALVNFAHLTLHPEFPIGAAVKNIGMGCVTRAMKMRLHGATVHPIFDREKCILCGNCLRMCPGEAFAMKRRRIEFDEARCLSCGDCFVWCEGRALEIPWGAETTTVQRRTCDAVRGVLSTFAPEKVVHFVAAIDITPGCDCFGRSELPIAPDLGFFASVDPVAVDQAALDALLAAPGYPTSRVEGTDGAAPGGDKIAQIWPALDRESYQQVLAESGLGNLRYRLVEV